MLKKLKALNPALPLHHIQDRSFLQFGKRITGYDFSEYMAIMAHRAIPTEGNIYVGRDAELTDCAATAAISRFCYADMPVQAGYCNGSSSRLNALEYHKGNEINIAVTDLVLLLGDIRDIRENTYPSKKAAAFYLPAGTACELYGTTLHFAPCRVTDSGYKCIVILPDGTNTPLPPMKAAGSGEEQLLWMRNKWLIAHPDSKPAASGAHIGITGENIELKYQV